MGQVLVVTNDFPPRRGGIESFVFSLCARMPAAELVVYTARMPGSEAVDARLPYPVVRDRGGTLLPTPRVLRDVRRVAAETGCDRAVFGSSFPLGLMAAGLRSVGVRRVVALTHGHEVLWARTPGGRSLLRRVARDADVLTYVSEHCRREIAGRLRRTDAAAMTRLSPGVDTAMFTPDTDGSGVRERLGIAAGRPVVLAASRLVERKGHDTLVESWPTVLARHRDAVLLVVGDGPQRRSLERRVRRLGLRASVLLVPAVDWEEMPQVYACGDVFALPCRTRFAGREPEALGIVFLEAAASGLPVVVGRSGGAPEALVDGETGYVVDPRRPSEVAERVCALLDDPARAREMGRRGRDWVAREHSPDSAAATLKRLLAG